MQRGGSKYSLSGCRLCTVESGRCVPSSAKLFECLLTHTPPSSAANSNTPRSSGSFSIKSELRFCLGMGGRKKSLLWSFGTSSWTKIRSPTASRIIPCIHTQFGVPFAFTLFFLTSTSSANPGKRWFGVSNRKRWAGNPCATPIGVRSSFLRPLPNSSRAMISSPRAPTNGSAVRRSWTRDMQSCCLVGLGWFRGQISRCDRVTNSWQNYLMCYLT